MSGSTSRVKDISRRYPSGWSKRKAKKDRLIKSQLAISKTRKMTEYFTEQRDIGDSDRSESEKYTAATEADAETDQQEKETVEEEDVSTTVFIFLNNFGMWPRLTVSTGFKREVRIANILTAIFLI